MDRGRYIDSERVAERKRGARDRERERVRKRGREGGR